MKRISAAKVWLGQFSVYFKKKLFHFRLKARKIYERVTETEREFQIFRTLVENYKFLEIYSTQMSSIITGSCTVAVNLAICKKKIQ